MARKYVLGSLSLLFILGSIGLLFLPFYQAVFNGTLPGTQENINGTIVISGISLLLGFEAHGTGSFANQVLTCQINPLLLIIATFIVLSFLGTIISLFSRRKLTFSYCLVNLLVALATLVASILCLAFLPISGLTLSNVPTLTSEQAGIGSILAGLALLISCVVSCVLTILTFLEYKFQVEEMKRQMVMENPELSGVISSFSYLPFFNVKNEKEEKKEEEEEEKDNTIQQIGQLSESDLEAILKSRKERREQNVEEKEVKEEVKETKKEEQPRFEEPEITQEEGFKVPHLSPNFDDNNKPNLEDHITREIEAERIIEEERKDNLESKLLQLKSLRDKEVISEEEFNTLKDRILKEYFQQK